MSNEQAMIQAAFTVYAKAAFGLDNAKPTDNEACGIAAILAVADKLEAALNEPEPPGGWTEAHRRSARESDARMAAKLHQHDYQYRIVLKLKSGDVMPLAPELNLAITQERLKDIMEDLSASYTDGWIERRLPGEWERI